MATRYIHRARYRTKEKKETARSLSRIWLILLLLCELIKSGSIDPSKVKCYKLATSHVQTRACSLI